MRAFAQLLVDDLIKDAARLSVLKSNIQTKILTPMINDLKNHELKNHDLKNHDLKNHELKNPRTSIQYLPHQDTGVRWMLERETEKAPVCRGGILGDDMGLGKTFQTIGLLKNSPFDYKTLILCPPALMNGWATELRDCGFAVSVATKMPLQEASVTLATYNIAHLHARDFVAARFGRVILDEGHVIRNGKATRRWWSCMAIASKSFCRWILSATPIQNGDRDWTNLCWWLHVRAGPSTIPTLAPVIMLRRTMEDLRRIGGSVPPAPIFIRHSLSIPATSAEGKLFRVLTDRLDTLMDSHKISALIKLELYMRIQQFLVHPQIYIESMRAKLKGAFPRPDWTGTATKFDAFSHELASSKDPTVVFCNFRAEMDRVVTLCKELGRSVWSIRGGMGSDAIGQAIREASRDSSCVIVVQIVAGGAGLNLQFCKRILFLSQHWNPAVVHQACGRCVRIGQTISVPVHFFSVDDPVADNIDRRMLDLHLAKISAAKSVCSSLYIGGPWL